MQWVHISSAIRAIGAAVGRAVAPLVSPPRSRNLIGPGKRTVFSLHKNIGCSKSTVPGYDKRPSVRVEFAPNAPSRQQVRRQRFLLTKKRDALLKVRARAERWQRVRAAQIERATAAGAS